MTSKVMRENKILDTYKRAEVYSDLCSIPTGLKKCTYTFLFLKRHCLAFFMENSRNCSDHASFVLHFYDCLIKAFRNFQVSIFSTESILFMNSGFDANILLP